MKYLLIAFILLIGFSGSAQIRTSGNNGGDELDSLRKLEEEGRDTIIFTAKYIRYTNLHLLEDSTQTLPLDTSLYNFHNYNYLNQPERPTIGLGNLGLPYRELLFTPRKNIGFDAGFHSFDTYRLTQDSIKYYRARSPFTSLYYVNGTSKEQIFRIIHSQNIKPNWNIGANYNRISAEGFYTNQKADHLNAAVFTWYESPGKRYNLLANGLFNTLKGAENGSVLNDTIFTSNGGNNNIPTTVKLDGRDPVKQIWKEKNLFLKQFYYIGRIDSVKRADSSSGVLPTQRISHLFSYSKNNYKFYKNQNDPYNVFPNIEADSNFVYTQDSTTVTNLRNELMYSFYLRGRAVSFIKNELKLDLGVQHDYYTYRQTIASDTLTDSLYKKKFQNITLKANIGYRFSDRVSIKGNLLQIAQGRNAGDYLYEAQTQFLISRSAGRIVLGAYIQNRSPEQIFERSSYTYHRWDTNFDKSKISNLSFSYLNPKLQFKALAEYFLIGKYLYFTESSPRQIIPVQMDNPVNMLKVTINKDFRLGSFNLENYLVVQKTDYQNVLRTPELYLHNSFYYSRRFSRAVAAQAGFDSRWNSSFLAPSYAINVSQFYNGFPAEYSTYPVIDVWAKFALHRANIFVRYDYANQGLFSKGYYTVSRYPMPDALFKFGVLWNFYD